MIWRRIIWMIVALAAAYVLMLMITTPTPSKQEPGIMTRILPTFWRK